MKKPLSFLFFISTLLAGISLISACDTNSSESIKTKDNSSESSRNDDPANRAVVFDPLIRSHKKAQGVQNILDDSEKKRRQELEEAGF